MNRVKVRRILVTLEEMFIESSARRVVQYFLEGVTAMFFCNDKGW